MPSCDSLLAAAIGFDCSNPQVAGIETDGCIINRKDIDFDASTRDSQNPNLLTNLALKSGKTGFSITQVGNQPFNGSNAAFVQGNFRNKFNKVVSFLVYDHSPACCHNIIDQIANGEFVVVLKNKYAGTDSKAKYEVFGFEAGLKQTEGSRDPYSEDTDGAWQITMQETGAPTSGLFLYKTDASTTEAAFESLIGS